MPRPLISAVLLMLLAGALSGCGHTPPPAVDNGAACMADLGQERVAFQPLELAEAGDPRCHIPTPVSVSRVDVPLSRPATMSCFLAERLAAFERGPVQQLAMQNFGRPVVRIDHLGAFSCRPNSGRPDRPSEHARGLAIDISGFRLADGTIVNIEHDWHAPGPKSVFLHQLARAACGYFSVVLTPDSNADHFNHFHLDLGPSKLCSA